MNNAAEARTELHASSDTLMDIFSFKLLELSKRDTVKAVLSGSGSSGARTYLGARANYVDDDPSGRLTLDYEFDITIQEKSQLSPSLLLDGRTDRESRGSLSDSPLIDPQTLARVSCDGRATSKMTLIA